MFGDLADALAEAYPGDRAGGRRKRPKRTRATRRFGAEDDIAAEDESGQNGSRPYGRVAPVGRSARMRLVGAELVESREILPGQWLQAYHAPELANGSRAGQFVHVRPGDWSGLVLRRPFSINTADAATGIITIHFRTVGRGTEWFTRLRPGDVIDMLGPLGRPFEVDPRSRGTCC